MSPEGDRGRDREGDAVAIVYDPGIRWGDERSGLLWAPLAGRPLVAWSLEAVVRAPGVLATYLLMAPDWRDAVSRLLDGEARRVAGILNRKPAWLASLEAAADFAARRARWVVLHDGSRPLATAELVAAGLAAARETGAASAAEPVKETVKRVEAGVVVETLDRSRLALLQTPQVFDAERLLAACRAYPPDVPEPADAASVALAGGIRLRTVAGSPENLAVRGTADLALAERLLARRLGS
jgi:2-C-methyl-D-erythritol 4-phosphate cytidylyltransferase